MTIDEAIQNFEHEIGEFEGFKRIHAVTHEDYAYIEKTKQLLEWLKELKILKEQRFNVRKIEPDDKDYPLAMKLVPFAEKYNLISIDGLTLVPLFEVIEAISLIKADIVRKNGVDCCPTCGKPINPPTIIEAEGNDT